MLWGANGLSNLSDGLAFVSMPLLVTSLTDDPRWVAGLPMLYAVVRLVVALPVGVYVDRFDRRSLLVVANVLRGVVLLGLAVTIQSGVGSLAVLYAVMAVVGALESIGDSAGVAVLPSLVRRNDLDRANSRVAAAQLVADEFVGPPLGGVLFAMAVVAPVYAMAGLWAAAGALALALPRMPRHRAGDAPTTSVYAEAREGVMWLARHRVVGSLAAISGLASVGYMLPFSVLVLFAQQRLGLGGAGYGALLAFSALGGLLGSFLAPRTCSRLGYRWTIAASLTLGALILAGLTVTTQAWLAGLLLALYILHAVVWNICSVSLRQRLVPDEMLGRVGAAARVVSLIGLAVGAVLGGLLATVHIALPTLVGALVFGLCVLLALAALRAQDPSPEGR